jgi:membrane fusion protein, multidrug efflux system
MGDDPQHAAAEEATAAPVPPAAPAPATAGRGWLLLAAVVIALVVAVGLGIRFQVIPLALSKPAPTSAFEQKAVIRYVLAKPPGAAGQAPGAVYIAEVRGDNELNLSFQVGGLIDVIGPAKSKNWEPGTAVLAGTELGRLKPDDYINRINAARARADLARKDYERMQNLFKTQTIPEQKLNEAEAQYKSAKADLAAAEVALNDTVLRAPISGTILDRIVSEGETVGPGQRVLRFSNLQRMTVEVGVPDTAIGQVKVNQEVAVVISALPGQSFRGRVSEVANAGEQGSRLFKVKIKVPNPDGSIKSGMTASVSLARQGSVPAGAVWVPLAALTTDSAAPGKLAVYVVADGKARKSAIETDEIAGNLILVTRGLKTGDQVVVTGVGTLYDGAAVDARLLEE